MHYINPSDIDEPEPPPTRCTGPAIPTEYEPRKCGRFLGPKSNGLCARCDAETHDWWTWREANDHADDACDLPF